MQNVALIFFFYSQSLSNTAQRLDVYRHHFATAAAPGKSDIDNRVFSNHVRKSRCRSRWTAKRTWDALVLHGSGLGNAAANKSNVFMVCVAADETTVLENLCGCEK